jgi:cobalamin biosynthesis Mg chelatase CobN
VPVMPPAWLAVLALTLALGAIWRLRRRQRA